MLNNLMLRFVFAFFVLGLLLMACKKDSAAAAADPRDPYVGRWIEISSNGIPSTTGRLDTLTISKSSSNSTGLVIGSLIQSGPFTASPNASGSYKADNTPINTGTTVNVPGYGITTAMLDNFTMAMVSGQLSATINYSAKAGTYTATEQYIDVLVKK